MKRDIVSAVLVNVRKIKWGDKNTNRSFYSPSIQKYIDIKHSKCSIAKDISGTVFLQTSDSREMEEWLSSIDLWIEDLIDCERERRWQVRRELVLRTRTG